MHSLAPRSSDQVIREMTGGGVDYCFECVGSVSVMVDAFNSSREVMVFCRSIRCDDGNDFVTAETD